MHNNFGLPILFIVVFEQRMWILTTRAGGWTWRCWSRRWCGCWHNLGNRAKIRMRWFVRLKWILESDISGMFWRWRKERRRGECKKRRTRSVIALDWSDVPPVKNRNYQLRLYERESCVIVVVVQQNQPRRRRTMRKTRRWSSPADENPRLTAQRFRLSQLKSTLTTTQTEVYLHAQ